MDRRSIIWGIAAIIGASVFFWLYPQVDTLRYIDASLEKSGAEKNGIHIAQSLNYIQKTGKPFVSMVVQRKIQKMLAQSTSRNSVTNHLDQNIPDRSIMYPWSVGFSHQTLFEQDNETTSEASDDFDIGPETLRKSIKLEILLSHEGEWLGLINHESVLPKIKFLTPVLSAVKPEWKQPLDSLIPPDSVVVHLFRFDFSENAAQHSLTDENSIDIGKYIQSGRTISLDRDDALNIAKYYLDHTIWKPYEFSLDSINTVAYQEYTAARLFLKRNADFGEQPLSIKVDVLPSGNILHMEPVMATEPLNAEEDTVVLFGLIQFIVFIVLGLMIVYQLFQRLKARTIDLKTGLVISVMTSVLIPVDILLVLSKSFLTGSVEAFQLIIISLVVLAATGAFGVILFFTLVSVGESISRQVWPEKIKVFDFIRSGLFLNKPVGLSLIHATFAAFVALGLWALLLYAHPQLMVLHSNELIFLSDYVLLPFLYPVTGALWESSTLILALFLVLGALIYKARQNHYWFYGMSFILFPIFILINTGFTPLHVALLAMSVTGVLFAYIFMRWGAVTVLLALFQFKLFITVSTSWMPVSSPDLAVFVTAVIIPLGLLTVGFIALIKGKNEDNLPQFVPEYIETLAQEDRIHQELEIAKRVQASFLPQTMPRIAPLDIAAICDPAYETAGDYFDVIQLDENRLAIAIGDVSGKGIQAAFYMTLAKGIIHSLCHEIDDPLKLLSRANDIFCRNSSKNTFLSMIYGVFDVKENSFTFVRAGHNPALVKRSGKTTVDEFKPRGLGLGIVEGERFRELLCKEKIYLNHGDTLILFTDGLNEALNNEHNFYGMQRLEHIISNTGTKNAHDLLLEIKKDILDFVGSSEQHDDLTLVIMKLNEQMKAGVNEITPVMLGNDNKKLL